MRRLFSLDKLYISYVHSHATMVLEERAKKLAKVALDDSLKITGDDVLIIEAETAFSEFTRYLAKSAEERGAEVISLDVDLAERKAMVERADVDELTAESKRLCDLASRANARIIVDAETNPAYLEGVPSDKIKLYAELARNDYLDMCWRNNGDHKIRPLVLAYPCEAEAKKARLSLDVFADALYAAAFSDYKKMAVEMGEIKQLFDNAEEVPVYMKDHIDMCFSLRDRGGEICAGATNMPDGEVAYGPVEDSVEGSIYFPLPAVYRGNLLNGISLEFERGFVVDVDSDSNHLFLEKILEIPGANRLGEFGIGCNPNLTRHMSHVLFDEKRAGTIHFALGASFTDNDLMCGGGLNDCAIHWDLVADMKPATFNPGGSIFVDGELVQENGVWCYK